MDPRQAIEKEQKYAKKMMRAGIMAALCGGAGFAAWILQRIFSGLTGSDLYNGAIDTIALTLMAHCALMTVTFIVARKWVLRVNLVMMSVIIPIIVLKTLAGLA